VLDVFHKQYKILICCWWIGWCFNYRIHLACSHLDSVEWKKIRVFKNSATSVHQFLDKVKLFSYQWLRTTDVTLATNYHHWWSSPCFVWASTNCHFTYVAYLDFLVNFCSAPWYTLYWGVYLSSLDIYIFHFSLFKKKIQIKKYLKINKSMSFSWGTM
jgi:hypothetical protein